MLECGLLGEKLGHSYSPAIHNMLGGYSYRLFERKPAEVEVFLRNGQWNGLNVTIPYKKTVFPYMDSVSDAAQAVGSINTIVKKPDGAMFGDNTDVYGFREMLRHSGIRVSGAKVLVLGSGGASAAVTYVLRSEGAIPVIISRSGENNYDNLALHADAEVIVNTTPLGMYPNNGASAVDLTCFPKCRGVLDVVYNPARTALLLQAEKLGIAAENGLYMLVAQAARSSERFTGIPVPGEKTEAIYRTLSGSLQNLILIGMPGCGKSTVARKLGELTGRRVLDSDEEITKHYHATPEELIRTKGEAAFRDMEHEVLTELGKESGAIIATGGGAVTRKDNYPELHQNGIILWLRRDVEQLATDHRPLSQQTSPAKLYAMRRPMYEAFADRSYEVEEQTAERILEELQ